MMVSVAMTRVWREWWGLFDCASVYPTSRRPKFEAPAPVEAQNKHGSRHKTNTIWQAWPDRADAPSGRHFLDYKASMPMYVKLILACILCLAVIAGLVLLVQRLF
jgi:hypothetical protein